MGRRERYSEESVRLALAVAEKAAANLRRTGHTVDVDQNTGRYIVSGRPRRKLIR
jgi:hypothetical protein